MSILPISALSGVTGSGSIAGIGTTATASTDGSGFAASLAGAVDNVQQLQSTANDLAVKAVTGNLDDIATATVAATRAQVTTELVAAVRNDGIDAFNKIMEMPA
jgi:flagellar hook-basal body complex protein FliE